jgi:hypothetical protein
MKTLTRISLIFMLFCLITIPLSAQRRRSASQPSPPPPPPASRSAKDQSPYVIGELRESTYVNRYLGLEVAAPEGWLIVNREFTKQMEKKGAELLSPSTNKPLVKALDKAAELTSTVFTMVKRPVPPATSTPIFTLMMEHVPLAATDSMAREYLESMKNIVNNLTTTRPADAPMFKVQIEPNVFPERIGGKQFQVQDSTVTTSTRMVKQRYHVRIIKNYAFIILFTYENDKDLQALQLLLSEVKFEAAS